MPGRTAEQKAADEALTAAIEQAVRAYGTYEGPWVMSEYVVVFAQHSYDGDGDGRTAVGSIYRDCDVPPHRVLGLLDYARTQIRAYITADDD